MYVGFPPNKVSERPRNLFWPDKWVIFFCSLFLMATGFVVLSPAFTEGEKGVFYCSSSKWRGAGGSSARKREQDYFKKTNLFKGTQCWDSQHVFIEWN